MSSLRFDDYLDQARSDVLKKMMRLWGARSQSRKEDCIAIISAGLRDPASVRAAVASLDERELNALALARQMGGEVEPGALAMALLASGVSVPSFRSYGSAHSSDLVLSLVHRGLFLSRDVYNPSSLPSDHESGTIFADERLLAHAGLPKLKPILLLPTARPVSATFRRAQAVTLDVISVLQAVQGLGGLQLTKNGAVRANDARRLMRVMGWQAQGLQVDGLRLPDPAVAFAHALRHSGLFRQEGSTLVLEEAIERWASRSYVEQIGALLRGFILAREWSEGENVRFDSYRSHYVQGRWALALALGALSPESDAFYAIDDFDQALFNRIGDHFSLDSAPYHPYYYQETHEEIRRAEAKRLAKARADWLRRERPWIALSLTSWLYFLGVVELGMSGGSAVSFRLTELGRALLHPHSAAVPPPPVLPTQPAWVVQPNFDIVVYLDRATLVQMAFLERHAERVNVQQYTALYRLTRDSVYRALEAGTTLAVLLASLQEGAGAPVPSNVVTEIREWGERRERMTLRRRARLLEFRDERAREAAFERGLEGTPIADRFVLLNIKMDPSEVAETVDYAKPLEPCLAVGENGVFSFKMPPRDLLIGPQLARWAEQTVAGKWQLTASSMSAAMKAGGRKGELLALLQERLAHPMPPLLAVALRAWSGESLPAELAPVAILRCAQPDVFSAIAHSTRFRTYLRGKLAPDLFVVDSERLPELQEALAWLGLSVSEELAAVPRRAK